MSIDLRHFRSFVIVAEEGNIGRAAQRLFITQPALSRQMQQLEREVGEPLLLRTGRGVELTDAGRQLVEKARVALNAVEDALAAGSSQEPHGKLILGLPQAGGRERWFELVQAFADHYRGVEVEVREALSEHLQSQVLAGDLHAAIALTPTRLPALRYTHLHDEPLWAWMHRDDPLAGRTELDLADLDGRQVPLIGGAPHARSARRATWASRFPTRSRRRSSASRLCRAGRSRSSSSSGPTRARRPSERWRRSPRTTSPGPPPRHARRA